MLGTDNGSNGYSGQGSTNTLSVLSVIVLVVLAPTVVAGAPSSTGADSIPDSVSDAGGDTAAAAVGMANAAPTAGDVSVTTSELTAVTASFSASDPDGDPLNYSIDRSPDHGSVVLDGDEFTYAPESGFSGVDSFVYRVSDDSGASDTATVTVTVEAENDAPVANDLRVSTTAGSAVTADFSASDPNGDSLRYSIARSPVHGSVSTSGDRFTYTPDSGFSGVDTFDYRVRDDDGASDTGTVTIDVDPPNEDPTAGDVRVSTAEGSAVSARFSASDPDGDALSYSVVRSPDRGSVSTSGDQFTYTPDSGFTGTDTFDYRVSDGNGGTDTATVTVTVEANTGPSASDVSVSTDADSTVSGRFSASDPDGDALSYSIERSPDRGSVSNSGDRFTYTPDSGFSGVDTFDYRVSDGSASDTATVTVTVEANTAPSASDVSVSTTAGSSVSGRFSASDPDGDSLSYSVVRSPDRGSVSNSGDRFTYTPDSGFSGTDSFEYRVSDGSASDTATVRVSVASASVFRNLSRSTPGVASTGGTLTVTVTAVMNGSGPFSLTEQFDGAVANASIRNVTVDGAAVAPLIARANSDTALVTLASTGPDATVRVTYEIQVATSGDSITIRGNASSGATQRVGTDTIPLDVFADLDRTVPTSVSTGGTATVTVTAVMDGDGPFSLTEQFDGPVANVSVRNVTVDGAAVAPLIARANSDTALVTLASTGPDATVRVTYDIEATASAGRITIRGNASSGATVRLDTDTITVRSCSLAPVAAGYDSDGDCAITLTELGAASVDFANGRISLRKLGTVSRAFANS